MHFYALNSGHHLQFPENGVRAATLLLLHPLVARGGRLPPPYDGFEIEIAHSCAGALFTLTRRGLPVSTCGLAWTAQGTHPIWAGLEWLYYSLSDQFAWLMAARHAPTPPTGLPWLGEMLHPGFPISAGMSTLGWLGDFERCLGWTILLSRGARA